MSDRLISGHGTAESDWQAWPGLQSLGECTLAQLVPPGTRTVIVAPHPDDEVLACGGLLATLATRGEGVLLVSVTDGDASHPGSAQLPRAALARLRREESAEGLRRLGVTACTSVRFAIPDGEVSNHVAVIASRLALHLRAGDVVFTTWRTDGHPDHEATASAVLAAARVVGCRHFEMPVWMWHWATPGDLRVPWHRMRRLLLTRHAVERKRHAIAAHKTQLLPRGGGLPPVLGAHALARLLRGEEYVFVPMPWP